MFLVRTIGPTTTTGCVGWASTTILGFTWAEDGDGPCSRLACRSPLTEPAVCRRCEAKPPCLIAEGALKCRDVAKINVVVAIQNAYAACLVDHGLVRPAKAID